MHARTRSLSIPSSPLSFPLLFSVPLQSSSPSLFLRPNIFLPGTFRMTPEVFSDLLIFFLGWPWVIEHSPGTGDPPFSLREKGRACVCQAKGEYELPHREHFTQEKGSYRFNSPGKLAGGKRVGALNAKALLLLSCQRRDTRGKCSTFFLEANVKLRDFHSYESLTVVESTKWTRSLATE